MHLCFSLDVVCVICGGLKATHAKPSGALALTSLKENDCITGVIELNADADGPAPILTVFVDSGWRVLCYLVSAFQQECAISQGQLGIALQVAC